MTVHFSAYLNSVARLDTKMRNLIKLNKDLADANQKLRDEIVGYQVRFDAQSRILEQLEKKLNG